MRDRPAEDQIRGLACDRKPGRIALHRQSSRMLAKEPDELDLIDVEAHVVRVLQTDRARKPGAAADVKPPFAPAEPVRGFAKSAVDLRGTDGSLDEVIDPRIGGERVQEPGDRFHVRDAMARSDVPEGRRHLLLMKCTSGASISPRPAPTTGRTLRSASSSSVASIE